MQSCLEPALGQNLPSRAAELILAALRPYGRLFHLLGEVLGHTDWVEHHIEVEGSAPIWQRPHRVPIHRRELVEKEVADLAGVPELAAAGRP